MFVKGIFASVEEISLSQLEEMPASETEGKSPFQRRDHFPPNGGETPFQRREHLLFKGGNTSLQTEWKLPLFL